MNRPEHTVEIRDAVHQLDLDRKSQLIRNAFQRVDDEVRKRHNYTHFDTPHGIWGPSSILDVYELLLRMHVDKRTPFVDLGSGDGRIAMIAALFAPSCGIEGDKALHETAVRIRDELIPQVPELSRCELRCADYTTEKLSEFHILFTFLDHTWPATFEERLMTECRGVLFTYHTIFSPKIIPKGKTYWMQQVPIVCYPLGVDLTDVDLWSVPLPSALDKDQKQQDDEQEHE